jgi:hypothetical protein
MAKDRDRTDDQSASPSRWLDALKNLPPETRIFGLVFVVIEAILAALIPVSNDQTVQYIALGMIATGLLCVLFLGIALLRTKSDTITIPAPPDENRNGEVTRFKYDVFVAAPIDSLTSNEERIHQKASINAVIDCIQKRCKLQNVYFAGEQAIDPKNYDQPSVGLIRNIQRIRASTYFLLIYPRLLPTSALVEVGMALALGKRSVWFVQKDVQLPYLMKEGAAAGGRADLPRINIRNYGSVEDIQKIIDNDPDQLFNFD